MQSVKTVQAKKAKLTKKSVKAKNLPYTGKGKYRGAVKECASD